VRLSLRSSARLQPIAAAETARAVAQVARDEHPPPMISAAGPEVADLTRLAATWLERTDRRVVALPVPLPPRLSNPLRSGALTSPEPDVRGQIGFGAWLAARS
jgi:uncharacterized protein YbjT (DUF2867 family)